MCSEVSLQRSPAQLGKYMFMCTLMNASETAPELFRLRDGKDMSQTASTIRLLEKAHLICQED